MRSGQLLEVGGEGFAGAVKFAAHGIAGLSGQFANLLIAQFLIGHEQEKEPVFLRQMFERALNVQPEFLGFQNAER